MSDMATVKFMQSLPDKEYSPVKKAAKRRGITVQAYIRDVIIPEWMKDHGLLVEEKKAVEKVA